MTRARIVLRSAEGAPIERVAGEVGVAIMTVKLWRRRYAQAGLADLADAPRPGHPPTYEPVRHHRAPRIEPGARPGPEAFVANMTAPARAVALARLRADRRRIVAAADPSVDGRGWAAAMTGEFTVEVRMTGRGERHSPATTDLPITMRLAEPPEPFDWLRSP